MEVWFLQKLPLVFIQVFFCPPLAALLPAFAPPPRSVGKHVCDLPVGFGMMLCYISCSMCKEFDLCSFSFLSLSEKVVAAFGS